MATIAELELPADEFALHRTLTTLDGIEFEIERVAAHSPEHVMPQVWVIGTDRDSIETALADDPSVEDEKLLSDQGDHWLYQMRWVDQVRVLVRSLVEEEATILTAFGKDDRWDFKMLFPDRSALTRTYEFCQDAELTIDLRRVYDHDDERAGQFGLTDLQKQTLTTAFDHGFYELPRDINQDELADELDITHQALSERLRRAHGTMIENGLFLGTGTLDME